MVGLVLKSGIDTYTVSCVPPSAGRPDLVADLLQLARNAISPPQQTRRGRRSVHYVENELLPPYERGKAISESRAESPMPMDQPMTHSPDWVALPPYVPFTPDASSASQDSATHSDDGAGRREHEMNTPIADALASQQLAALARVSDLFEQEGIDYWLFGGWAVDFYAGSVTRAHDDVDIAIWLKEAPRIAELLEQDGWRHAPLDDEDGGTGYERGAVRLELTYLVRHPDGAIFTPLRQGRGAWSMEALANDVGEIQGVRSRLVGLAPLMRAKSSPRDDPEEAAKDRADFDQLSRLGTSESD